MNQKQTEQIHGMESAIKPYYSFTSPEIRYTSSI